MPEETTTDDGAQTSEETTTEATTETTTTASTDPAQSVDSLPDWAQTLIRTTRQEAAGYRTKVRELEPFAVEAAARADAEKTELERAQEALATTQTELATIRAESVRTKVATAKGLTPAQAARLVGNTEEELAADADELLATFGGKTPPLGRPTENLRGGATPAADITETNPAKLAALLPRTGF